MDKIQVWLSLVGLLIVVVQLFIALRLFKGNLHNKLYDEISKTHKPFLDHPELRPFFHHNAMFKTEELGDKEYMKIYLRARSVAEIYYDVFEIIFIQINEQNSMMLRFIPFSSPSTLSNWKTYIEGMIENSYFLASYLKENDPNIQPEKLRDWVSKCIQEHWGNEGFLEAKDWRDKIA